MSSAALFRCALLAAACSAGLASAAQRALLPCSAGAAPANGSLGCEPCPRGTFSPAGAAACLPCRVGFYALGGASACTECPEDHFCANPGEPPQPCAKTVKGGYALPGSTRCWSLCTATTTEGASKMIFDPPQPCTDGFTDLPWQALWPLAPSGTAKSLYPTGGRPP